LRSSYVLASWGCRSRGPARSPQHRSSDDLAGASATDRRGLAGAARPRRRRRRLSGVRVLADKGGAGGARAVHRPPHTGSSSSCRCGAAFDSATRARCHRRKQRRGFRRPGAELSPWISAAAPRSREPRAPPGTRTTALRHLIEKTNESGRFSAGSRPQVRDPTAHRDPGGGQIPSTPSLGIYAGTPPLLRFSSRQSTAAFPALLAGS
jgi:hypothetical protein